MANSSARDTEDVGSFVSGGGVPSRPDATAFYVSGTLRTGEYTILRMDKTRQGWTQRQHPLFPSGRHMNRDYVCRETSDALVDWFRHDFRSFQMHQNIYTQELCVLNSVSAPCA